MYRYIRRLNRKVLGKRKALFTASYIALIILFKIYSAYQRTYQAQSSEKKAYPHYYLYGAQLLHSDMLKADKVFQLHSLSDEENRR